MLRYAEHEYFHKNLSAAAATSSAEILAMHFPGALITNMLLQAGLYMSGSVGPKSVITGISLDDAIWAAPESLDIKRLLFSKRAVNCRRFKSSTRFTNLS